MLEVFEGLVWLVFALVLYFLPTVIGSGRRHQNMTPILLVNLFLGWTIAGWFVALVWSTTSNVRARA